MNLVKDLLPLKWHLPDLLPYFYNFKKKSNAMQILNKALSTSTTTLKVLSANSLAYNILVYLDTDTEKTFKQYLQSYFNLSIKKPDDFASNEVSLLLLLLSYYYYYYYYYNYHYINIIYHHHYY